MSVCQYNYINFFLLHFLYVFDKGIRNRIARETKREKKLAKKQKRLDQRSSKQAKREHEGNNVQLRKLDK